MFHLDLGFLSQGLNILAGLVVSIVGPFIAKKIHDHDTRSLLGQIADAALVFAIQRTKGDTGRSLEQLLQAVVAEILADPRTPASAKSQPEVVKRMAAAAIARNTTMVPTMVTSGGN